MTLKSLPVVIAILLACHLYADTPLDAIDPMSIRQLHEEIDVQLDDKYKALLSAYKKSKDKSLESDLIKSQNAWELYRDAQCALVDRSDTKPTIDQGKYTQTYVTLSVARINFIESALATEAKSERK